MIEKVLKSKSGMTLTELLVGMLIAALLMASISAVLVPTLKIYKTANDLAEMNTLLDNLANQITSDFSIAKTVNFTDTGEAWIAVITKTNDSYITYSVNDDGILCRDATPVLAEGFYKNKEVSVEYYNGEDYDGLTELDSSSLNPVGAKEFIIRIILSEKGGSEMIRRDYAVKPIMLNQYN